TTVPSRLRGALRARARTRSRPGRDRLLRLALARLGWHQLAPLWLSLAFGDELGFAWVAARETIVAVSRPDKGVHAGSDSDPALEHRHFTAPTSAAHGAHRKHLSYTSR